MQREMGPGRSVRASGRASVRGSQARPGRPGGRTLRQHLEGGAGVQAPEGREDRQREVGVEALPGAGTRLISVPEEEGELAQRVQAGCGTARHRMIAANLRLVVRIAGEFAQAEGLPAMCSGCLPKGYLRPSLRSARTAFFIPVELRVCLRQSGGWGGIRTLGALLHTRFPSVRNRPLCHPS